MSSPPKDKLELRKLDRDHRLDKFDCGVGTLNRYLINFAAQSQSSNSAVTYVAAIENLAAGFYCLSAGQIEYADAPERLFKGLGRHPIPIILLGRLGVDQKWQGKGLGAALLKDALRRCRQAAEIAGIRAVVVHSKSSDATAFYKKYGFTSFENLPDTLYLLMKDLRTLL